MFKINRLVLAIAEHEGWKPIAEGDNNSGSRAYRNHNPGNLRSSPFQIGTAGGYAVFKTDIIGFWALEYDLIQKAKGNTSTGLNGNSTIKDLIYKYAPPSDNNDTEAYLKNVLLTTGFPETMRLSELLES